MRVVVNYKLLLWFELKVGYCAFGCQVLGVFHSTWAWSAAAAGWAPWVVSRNRRLRMVQSRLVPAPPLLPHTAARCLDCWKPLLTPPEMSSTLKNAARRQTTFPLPIQQVSPQCSPYSGCFQICYSSIFEEEGNLLFVSVFCTSKKTLCAESVCKKIISIMVIHLLWDTS